MIYFRNPHHAAGVMSNSPPNNLRLWLVSAGMAQYIEAFEENGVTVSMIADLTDDDLKSIGVKNLVDRKTLLAKAKKGTDTRTGAPSSRTDDVDNADLSSAGVPGFQNDDPPRKTKTPSEWATRSAWGNWKALPLPVKLFVLAVGAAFVVNIYGIATGRIDPRAQVVAEHKERKERKAKGEVERFKECLPGQRFTNSDRMAIKFEQDGSFIWEIRSKGTFKEAPGGGKGTWTVERKYFADTQVPYMAVVFTGGMLGGKLGALRGCDYMTLNTAGYDVYDR